MARRKSVFEDLFDALCVCPWWVSVVVTGGGFLFFKYILPGISFENPVIQGIATGVSNFAPLYLLSTPYPSLDFHFPFFAKEKTF